MEHLASAEGLSGPPLSTLLRIRLPVFFLSCRRCIFESQDVVCWGLQVNGQILLDQATVSVARPCSYSCSCFSSCSSSCWCAVCSCFLRVPHRAGALCVRVFLRVPHRAGALCVRVFLRVPHRAGALCVHVFLRVGVTRAPAVFFCNYRFIFTPSVAVFFRRCW